MSSVATYPSGPVTVTIDRFNCRVSDVLSTIASISSSVDIDRLVRRGWLISFVSSLQQH